MSVAKIKKEHKLIMKKIGLSENNSDEEIRRKVERLMKYDDPVKFDTEGTKALKKEACETYQL